MSRLVTPGQVRRHLPLFSVGPGGHGFGSEAFGRACEIAAEFAEIDGLGPRACWCRLRKGAPELARYHLTLPPVTIALTPSPAGRMIGEHLAIRTGARWRFRAAQPVLRVPDSFAEYLRGRHRQAVRTNVNRARRDGVTVHPVALPMWAPGADDTRAAHLTPGPVERWTARGCDGTIAADAILSVDQNVALLHGLTSTVADARWLLHTSIVEHLCGRCELLLVNSDAAYLMTPGARHFARLLGYEIARLRPLDDPRGRADAGRVADPAPVASGGGELRLQDPTRGHGDPRRDRAPAA